MEMYVILQEVWLLAKTPEVRLAERIVGLFQKASIKGYQRTPCHKNCLPALNTTEKFYRHARREKSVRQFLKKALPGGWPASGSGVGPIQMQKPLPSHQGGMHSALKYTEP